ncbi:FecR domain-containing protein [Spirosoma sp. BT702]|uniref:FecR domain-containing protein n=1 Tax=Spirosoma profusum TaxID=2771354 RepID=A0A927API0_9BACT|nr:FecR domain-containing protein [Spirosoma profusum]MBD2704624.1 FecR domain-containing protein [Spirosoma profusum]
MNEPQAYPTKASIFAYFAHQATPLERQQIESWLTTDQGATLYFTYLDEWERQHPQFQPDLNRAHERFTQFMNKTNQVSESGHFNAELLLSEPLLTVQSKNWLRSYGWLAMAASIVLVGGLWLSVEFWYYTTWSNGYHQLQSIQLPDGSAVELGAHSSLRYPRFGFGWGTRHVWLTGEAQFQITHQANAQRFQVHTPDQTIIEVLGTVFVVNSRRNTTRVMLKTGRISMTTPQSNQPLMLTPGDLVTVTVGQTLHKQKADTLSAQVTWHDHQFVFHDTPLQDIVVQLHDTFGVTVQIPQTELMNRTVSGTFQAETAADLLQALKLMMNLEVDDSPTGFTLTQSIQ